jgi:hypothetical protein
MQPIRQLKSSPWPYQIGTQQIKLVLHLQLQADLEVHASFREQKETVCVTDDQAWRVVSDRGPWAASWET